MTQSGEEVEYDAQVTFAPSSVRLYAPPVRIEEIQQYTDKDLLTFARAYVELDWNIYARIPARVASEGTFIS